MRIAKYLARHKLAVLLVACLLVVQAFCDLSLPKYVADIVDVGIQQSGVEDAATIRLSQRSYQAALAYASMMDGEDGQGEGHGNAQLLASSYDLQEDGTYALNETGFQNRQALNELVALPLIWVHFASDALAGDEFDAGASELPAPSSGRGSLAAGGFDGFDEALAGQQAIAAARAEYECVGVDTAAMQMDYLLWVGSIMLLLAAFSMAANVAIGLIASVTGSRIGRDLRKSLFSRVVSFGESEVNRFSAASLITRGTNDIQLIQMVSIMFLRIVLYAPILAIGGIVMVSQTNLSMGWVIGLGVVCVLAVAGLLMAITMPKFKVMQKLIDRVNLVSREIITGLPVIRAFGMEERERARFDVANRKLMETQLFTSRAMSFMMPGMMMVMNCMAVLIVWVGGHYIDAGVIQAGDMIAFITYSMIVVAAFLMIGMIAIFLPRANVAAERIDEVIAAEPSVVDGGGVAAECNFAAGAPASSQGVEIRFDDVSFRYDGGSANVLDHVSFTAAAGKTTAIVGSTGSGKSTVIKLIERFYDAAEGAVLVDGVDVRYMAQSDLRGKLGYVPQKAFLFSGTIATNVSYGAPDDSEQRMRRALGIAQAEEFVDSKEDGLDAAVSQGGTNVSGGQRQRLAIARALSRDAGAYLFDDSFSALDYKTDALLRQQLASQLAGRTVLIVAQRIATIMHADHIVVLDDGRVVGQGTHGQLLAQCPAYCAIARSQLSDEELGLEVTEDER